MDIHVAAGGLLFAVSKCTQHRFACGGALSERGSTECTRKMTHKTREVLCPQAYEQVRIFTWAVDGQACDQLRLVHQDAAVFAGTLRV